MIRRLDRFRDRITLDKRNGWLGGVCAGFARYFNIDPTFVRVGLIVAAIFYTKIVIAAYVICWVLLSER